MLRHSVLRGHRLVFLIFVVIASVETSTPLMCEITSPLQSLYHPKYTTIALSSCVLFNTLRIIFPLRILCPSYYLSGFTHRWIPGSYLHHLRRHRRGYNFRGSPGDPHPRSADCRCSFRRSDASPRSTATDDGCETSGCCLLREYYECYWKMCY
jgi:hypothetical protein